MFAGALIARERPNAQPSERLAVMHCSHEHKHCGAAKTLSVLGEKWKLPLLLHIVQGKNRFGQLQRSMKGISAKSLTFRLRELEYDGREADESNRSDYLWWARGVATHRSSRAATRSGPGYYSCGVCRSEFRGNHGQARGLPCQ